MPILLGIAVVVVVVIAAIWAIIGGNNTTAPVVEDTKTPAVATSPTPTAAAPASTTQAAETPVDGGCQPINAEGFVPTRFVIPKLGADEEVLALGVNDEGAIEAPPKNLPRTAAWWNQGPRPGSDKGKTVFSIHSYRTGKALGNEMFTNGESQLEPGDRLDVYGVNGEKACYEYVEAKKIAVTDYDPDSDVMVDFEGEPLLTAITCTDFEGDSEIWKSRVFFYFKPVTE
ncbi:MAG: hypothetical protein CSA64_03460 [Arachnia propionica]|nr:MAG: hypothetical protein CSA64_03460 [Arachnia propionica]